MTIPATPLTDADLRAITERSRREAVVWTSSGVFGPDVLPSAADVPVLLAEVARLRGERDALHDVCRRLWADHLATPGDQVAARRLYDAWRDMGAVLARLEAAGPLDTR